MTRQKGEKLTTLANLTSFNLQIYIRRKVQTLQLSCEIIF